MGLKVGIQLFSVRDLMKEDVVGTINKVSELGYKYIEPANHNASQDFGVGFAIAAEELKKLLHDNEVKVISNHIFPFTYDNAKNVIEYNKKIGNKYLVYPMECFESKEQILELCEKFNRIGKLCNENDMMFLYHNHYQEFQLFDGKTVLDYIVENTNPEYVGLELDTFWALRGGWNPVDAIKHFGSRIKLLHQKDYRPVNGEAENIFEDIGIDADITTRENFRASYSHAGFTEVGTGVMDIQSIIDAANEVGSVEYIILEQDFTEKSQIESITISMESFKKYKGIQWD